ncbi:MAG: hypothetical protein ACOX6D_01360 [Thermoguttaceae bacterium]
MTNSKNNWNFSEPRSAEPHKLRRLLRFFSPDTSLGILSTLALVTIFLGAVGGIYLKWCEPSPDVSDFRLTRSSSGPTPSLALLSTEATNAVSVSAGFLNDFFVFQHQKLGYYRLFDTPNGGLQVRGLYDIPLDKVPTASHFVMNSESVFYGKLLAAFSNTICIFDPETKGFTPYIELNPEAEITGLAADSRDLFAADAGLGKFYRIDPKKEVSDWGLPSEEYEFPGFQKGRYSFFDLDVDTKNETIFVTHPDKFRVEAFSALDGHWIRERSLEKAPSRDGREDETFTGAANPASIMMLGDGSFLTTDAGPQPSVRIWKADGSFQAKVDSPAVTAPMAADQAPLVSITFTEIRAVRLLILLPTGQLACLTVPP